MCAIVGILVGLLVVTTPVSVAAQTEPTTTPTVTITPTPIDQVGVTLTSGNVFVVERRISYGEIAIVVVILLAILTMLAVSYVRIPKQWF